MSYLRVPLKPFLTAEERKAEDRRWWKFERELMTLAFEYRINFKVVDQKPPEYVPPSMMGSSEVLALVVNSIEEPREYRDSIEHRLMRLADEEDDE